MVFALADGNFKVLQDAYVARGWGKSVSIAVATAPQFFFLRASGVAIGFSPSGQDVDHSAGRIGRAS